MRFLGVGGGDFKQGGIDEEGHNFFIPGFFFVRLIRAYRSSVTMKDLKWEPLREGQLINVSEIIF